MDSNRVYDCIIIGGGPAGLTCAIFLGRYRRRVLVLDTGRPRNAAARGIHGFLGQDSIRPAELLQRGRGEAERVGVQFQNAEAISVVRDGDIFVVHCAEDRARARRIVLAYGVRDTLPEIEGIERWYGAGVYHCPDCDGFEVSDQRVAVIGRGRKAAGLALELLLWTDEVTVLTDGAKPRLPPAEKSKLEAEGIEVCEQKIVALVGDDDHLQRITFTEGSDLPVDAVFFAIRTRRSCKLAEALGCEASGNTEIVVDEHRQTSIEGVYAIGDLVRGSQLVVTAAADGAIAAVAINRSLLPPARRVG